MSENTTKVYNYSPETGEYICATDARESPLEPGVYLVPAYATLLAPPEITEQYKVAVFKDSNWQIVPDYRSCKAVIIDSNGLFVEESNFEIGEDQTSTKIVVSSLPDSSIYKPKWDSTNKVWIQGEEIPLQDLQEAKKSEINKTCSDKIESGFYSYAEMIKGSDNQYQALLYKSDLYHGLQISNLANIAIQHKQGLCQDLTILWKTANQENDPCHLFTDDAMIKLNRDYISHYEWCKTTSDQLIYQIYSATAKDEIDAITFPDEPEPTYPNN